MREIKHIISSVKVNMGGVIIEQPLPHPLADSLDPFLLVHHWKDRFEGGQRQREVGVPPHPHRGFSPVTLVFQGAVHHRDSLGNDSIIKGGGTQWINAGKGITHSERPAKEIAEQGGDFELIQFWINAPAKHKMDAAKYFPLPQENTPVIESKNGKIYVVAGEYGGKVSPIPTHSPLKILTLEVEPGGRLDLQIPTSYNVLLYLLEGQLQLDSGKELSTKQMAIFENNDESIAFEAKQNSKAIVLSGEPINEPVFSYGPFVMNTEIEIMQAMRDAQTGRMGVLIEEF